MGIEWDDGWEEEIARMAIETLQPKMDALSRRHKGKSVSEIKPVLDREMRRWGGSFSDDAELTRVAKAISKGDRVILRPTG